MTRPRSQDSKLDELIKLQREQSRQMVHMQAQLEDVTAKVEGMAPTVQQVADAVTFAKVGRTVFRFLIGIGIAATPIIWWMNDRWHILGQLFRKL